MATLRRVSELYGELRKIIDIPPEWLVRRLVLTLDVDQVPTVEVEMFAQPGTGEPITKRYMLEQIPDSAEPRAGTAPSHKRP